MDGPDIPDLEQDSRRRRMLGVFVLLAVFAGGAAALLHLTHARGRRAALEQEEASRLALQVRLLEEDVKAAVSDAGYLSGFPALAAAVEKRTPAARRAAAGEFIRFCRSKPAYDHVRIIDEKGRELVRVDCRGDAPAAVPASRLQDKAHRYYVKDTLALESGGVYVSPFDLNIENGVIERPYRPTIRFGVPLLDSKGQMRGVLVLNYLGERSLARLRAASARAPGELWVLNSRGHWLLGPSGEREWGFMFDEEGAGSAGSLLAGSWNRVLREDAGQFVDAQGLQTFASVSASTGGESWKLVSHVPAGMLYAPGRRLLFGLAGACAGLLAALGAGFWLLEKTVTGARRGKGKRMGAVSMLLVTATAIFLCEAVLILAGPLLPPLPPHLLVLRDSTLLVLFISPTLFFLLIRPLMRHIDERRFAQEKLSRANKIAEEASVLKDKFMSLVSHDLRTPLAVMLGTLKVIKEDEGSLGLPEQVIDGAIASGERMNVLVGNLLAKGLVESGKIRPRRELLPARPLLEGLLEDIRHSASRKGIEVSNELPEGMRIYADGALIGEVLRNLVLNALKFCEKGSAVKIRAPEGEDAAIAVTDTGVGIEPERLGALFRFDTPSSTIGTGGERGTGLGLPLCRQIVEAHGGVLDVKSAPGKGSTFTIRLPADRPVVALVGGVGAWDGLEGRLAGIGVKSRKVLPNGAIMETLRRSPPDLVLLSLRGLDGLPILQALQRDSGLAEVPVFVFGGDEARERAMGFGAAEFCEKDLLGHEVLGRIGRWVGAPVPAGTAGHKGDR